MSSGGTLYMDHREKKPRELLGSNESHIKILYLPYGDFIMEWLDKICFFAERKTYKDFKQSNREGRLLKQMENMINYRKDNKKRFIGGQKQRIYLLLECDDKQYQKIVDNYMDKYTEFNIIHTIDTNDTNHKLDKLNKSIEKMDYIESLTQITGRIKRIFS